MKTTENKEPLKSGRHIRSGYSFPRRLMPLFKGSLRLGEIGE